MTIQLATILQCLLRGSRSYEATILVKILLQQRPSSSLHFPSNFGVVGKLVPKDLHEPDATDAEERAQGEEVDESHLISNKLILIVIN